MAEGAFEDQTIAAQELALATEQQAAGPPAPPPARTLVVAPPAAATPAAPSPAPGLGRRLLAALARQQRGARRLQEEEEEEGYEEPMLKHVINGASGFAGPCRPSPWLPCQFVPCHQACLSACGAKCGRHEHLQGHACCWSDAAFSCLSQRALSTLLPAALPHYTLAPAPRLQASCTATCRCSTSRRARTCASTSWPWAPRVSRRRCHSHKAARSLLEACGLELGTA